MDDLWVSPAASHRENGVSGGDRIFYTCLEREGWRDFGVVSFAVILSGFAFACYNGIKEVITVSREKVERLFAWLIHRVEVAYHEEINMAMDCFLEETFTREELERFLEYVLDRVKSTEYDAAFDYVSRELANA